MAEELDVEGLLDSLAVWREGGHSLSELFVEAGVDAIGDEEFAAGHPIGVGRPA